MPPFPWDAGLVQPEKLPLGAGLAPTPAPIPFLERLSGGGCWEQRHLPLPDAFWKSSTVSSVLEALCCHDGCSDGNEVIDVKAMQGLGVNERSNCRLWHVAPQLGPAPLSPRQQSCTWAPCWGDAQVGPGWPWPSPAACSWTWLGCFLPWS